MWSILYSYNRCQNQMCAHLHTAFSFSSSPIHIQEKGWDQGLSLCVQGSLNPLGLTYLPSPRQRQLSSPTTHPQLCVTCVPWLESYYIQLSMLGIQRVGGLQSWPGRGGDGNASPCDIPVDPPPLLQQLQMVLNNFCRFSFRACLR